MNRTEGIECLPSSRPHKFGKTTPPFVALCCGTDALEIWPIKSGLIVRLIDGGFQKGTERDSIIESKLKLLCDN